MTSFTSQDVVSSPTIVENYSRKAWIVCLSAALFFFYEFIQMHMFNAINESLRVAFHVDATHLGILSSTYLIGDVAFLLPAGILLDRFSIRTILLCALSVCIIGTVGFALTSSLPWAAFFHGISGCGNAFCFLACIMLVSRWFEPKRQAFVVGIVVTMAFMGGVMAETPLAWITSIVGWRLALIYDATLGCLFFLIIAFNVKDSPPNWVARAKEAIDAHGGKVSVGAGMKKVILNAQNGLAGIYTCLLNLPIMVLDAVWGITYLRTVHHLTYLHASTVAAMIFFGSMIACPIAGFISDRAGLRRMPMIIGAILSLAMVSLLVFVPGWHYGSLLVLFFFIGIFTSTQIISYPLASESNDFALTGTAVGFVSFIIMGGAAIAQVVFGQLLDNGWEGMMQEGQRIYSVGAYHHAMLMFPVVMAVGLLASLLIKETYCTRKETK